MEINVKKHYNLCEINVVIGDTKSEVDVTLTNGLVPEYLIEQFEQVVSDLKAYNMEQVERCEINTLK